jgi:hypothetical protein
MEIEGGRCGSAGQEQGELSRGNKGRIMTYNNDDLSVREKNRDDNRRLLLVKRISRRAGSRIGG